MFPALLFLASLVNDVRDLIARHDFAGAEQQVRLVRAQHGATPEVALAMSWLARGAMDASSYDKADSWAAETRKVSDGLLRARRLDADPYLPLALGASIEVHGQVMAAHGERVEAIAWLREQARLFAGTSITERIRKDINLLNLVGKPAPALAETEWLGAKPAALASLRGHPVLLFFWAHWCGDCKGEVAILANIQKTFAPQGLKVIAPTRLYGYVAGGEDAPPAVEKAYTEKVRQQYYSALPNMAAPVSAANFQVYGASTTPTLVLIDGTGIVRMYHPGAMLEAELAGRIRSLLKK
ncbi:MAG TPA: TlpA disulfide reductase family protein [Candidatus Sulfopaludibacter sp.]|jgi:thiol-disulfide isomerase/thioredoxin|nr:TlpA disulfide reductase family protein [Candidatus Sulfopaludibacter sp.]